MGRTIRNRKLDTPAAREAIRPGKTVHWSGLAPGRTLGYRRGLGRGTWIAKCRMEGVRREKRLGLADDGRLEADGVKVLDFEQAQKRAWDWFATVTSDVTGEATSAGPYTVSRSVDDYLAALERQGKRSLQTTRYVIERHIRPALGNIRVDQITARKIEHWHAALAQTPRRPLAAKKKKKQEPMTPDQQRARRDTANRILTILKAALNLALRDRRVAATGQAWRAVKPFANVSVARVRFLSQDEQRKLVQACADDFGQLVRGALLTGMRYGEIGRLRVSDFDASAKTLYVAISKSGRPRHVYLDDEAARFFTGLCEEREAEDFIFVRRDGSPWLKDFVRKPMRRACTAAKIAPCNFHELRHSAASRWVAAGFAMKLVAEQLGHTSTKMTERFYAHVAPTHMSEVFASVAPAGLEPPRVAGTVTEIPRRGRRAKA